MFGYIKVSKAHSYHSFTNNFISVSYKKKTLNSNELNVEIQKIFLIDIQRSKTKCSFLLYVSLAYKYIISYLTYFYNVIFIQKT